ncbi:MAG TPA: hypothetical protein PKN13_08225 [Accumulibacter sp.]|nr:hypothetical protein [Accumulibacter sp.]HMW17840.1 hypothetical protein [Accumulibacter sp.]HMX22135.1 hypothetical protein [Accumulibacter sp.]HMY06169.1 hypothetical protein [Accumulibacter sp.]HNC17927.1 hypothetical protein [Accumulibacter sp.]
MQMIIRTSVGKLTTPPQRRADRCIAANSWIFTGFAKNAFGTDFHGRETHLTELKAVCVIKLNFFEYFYWQWFIST